MAQGSSKFWGENIKLWGARSPPLVTMENHRGCSKTWVAQHNRVGETVGRRRPGRTSEQQPLWARPCSCNSARGFLGNTLGKAPCQRGHMG